MSKKHLGIFLIILCAATMLLFLTEKKNKTTKLSSPQMKTPEKKLENKPQEHAPILAKNKIMNDNSALTTTIVNDCLHQKWEFRNLTQLKDQILLTESITDETTELENIHFLDKNKENYRAQIIYNDKHKELRLFKVLADGLPDFIQIPSEDRLDPDSTTLAKYINFGSIQWQQTQKKLTTAQGNTLQVEIVNSQVEKLDYFLASGTSLHCQNIECQCK